MYTLVLVLLVVATRCFTGSVTVAVKSFRSFTEEEIEADVMTNFTHPNFPLLTGACTLSKPYLLVTSSYNISDKPYTVSCFLQSKSMNLSVNIWVHRDQTACSSNSISS